MYCNLILRLYIFVNAILMYQKSSMYSFKSKFNSFYIGLIILWPVLQNLIGVDGKGRIPFVVTLVFFTFSFIYNYKQLFTKPLRLWWIWVGYALVNTFFIQGTLMQHDQIMGFITYVIAGPLLAYCIITESLIRRAQISKYVGYIVLLYLACALLTPSTNLEDEHGISMFGNIVPISIVFFVFIFAVRFVHKDITFKTFGIITVVAVFFVVVSATRKAFGGMAIVLFFTYLSKVQKLSFKTIYITLLIGLLLYVLSDLFQSSDLWIRFSNANKESATSDYKDNLFLSLMDDRAIMYVTGWDIFCNNLWFGIGLRNYLNSGFYAYTLHTEYMVQMAECGIIGSTLFLWFYLKMAKGLVRGVKLHSSEALVYFGGYMTIVFMSFTAWTYNQPIFWICIGFILAYIEINKNRKSYENSYCRS